MYRTIRYLGAKTKLIPAILATLASLGVRPGRALDAFAGSGRVSWALRQEGYEVVAVDTLRMCTALSSLAISSQEQPTFAALAANLGITRSAIGGDDFARAVLQHLTGLPPRASFVTREYSPSGMIAERERKYFTVENAGRIDAIRHAIHEYSVAGLLNGAEHDYLLAVLIVAASERSNTQGHTDSYLETFQPRALLPVQLSPPLHLPNRLPPGSTVQGDAAIVAASLGSLELVYLDPPYNHRRYDSYYHVLERIALGWFDDPVPACVGKTGKPAVQEERSPWCGRDSAPGALESFLAGVDARHLVMSYSSGGVLQPEVIEETIRTRGLADTFALTRVRHPEYRGSRTRGGGEVEEYLFYARLN
jgi:adenine-specific DNA-methyltransferase